VAKVVAQYEDKLSAELDKPVGKTDTPLDAVAENVRAREIGLGDLFADAMKEATGADIAILNSGSIRSNRVYEPGVLTRRDVLAMHPFGGSAVLVEATGRAILEALNNGVSKMDESAGRFPQVSGLQFTVDAKKPVGSRVQNVLANGQPLDLDRKYKVAVTDYMAKGGDGYKSIAASKLLVNAESSPLLVDAVREKIQKTGTVAPRVEGRIRFAEAPAPATIAKRPLILDTDMGIDSVLGMLYLLKSPTVDLRAVTISNGVADVKAGTQNALRILELTGNRAIPVAAGPSTPLVGQRGFPSFWREQADTLGGEGALKLLPAAVAKPFKGSAADLIIQELNRSSEPITIVTMGPLTNIALALRKNPQAAKKIGEIIAMGGALRVPGNVDKPFVGIKNSVAEWNFYIDPQAAREVLQSGVSIRLLPLDASQSLPITPAFVKRLREGRRDATSNLLLALLDAVDDGIEGGWYYFWDTLAGVVAARPDVAGSYGAQVQVETKDGPTLGQTRIVENGGASVRVGEEINRQKFEDYYLNVVMD
jgi:inosine-uridine nucleoside N-ribohydrolase